MTRDKLMKTVSWALKRHQGAGVDRQAEAICDAVELVLEQESSDASEMPVEFPMVEAKPQVDLPPSPAVDSVPRWIDTLAREQHVAEAQREEDTPKHTVEEIMDQLYKFADPAIRVSVIPPGRDPMTLVLHRNIVASHGFGMVKLSYKVDGFGDEMEVSEVFCTTQKELDVAGAVMKLQKAAEHRYAPKPRVIVSASRFTSAPLSFDLNAPHEDADERPRLNP